MTPDQFACLGIHALGPCAYNPGQPAVVYFSVGDAIAGLALTLAIQQFLKPIYKFRLYAAGVRMEWLYVLVFLGLFCAMVAAVLPSLPIPHRGILAYPIVWEIFGGLSVGFAYVLIGFISIRPARLSQRRPMLFIQAAATMLSSADDDVRADFAEDLLAPSRNLESLVQIAAAWEAADRWSSRAELDRLRRAGLPARFQGRAPISAFYIFAHRRELQGATDAATFLRILADKDFCSVLVRKAAWRTAATLERFAAQRIGSDPAKHFIQQIATQAIVHDESLMAKEVDFLGFGTIRVLSESLFSDWFMLRTYSPLSGLTLSGFGKPSAGRVDRLNKAVKMMLDTTIKGQSYWDCHYMYAAMSVYEGLLRDVSYRRFRKDSVDYLGTLHFGITELCESLDQALDQLEADFCHTLFDKDPDKFKTDLVHTVARIAYDALECLSSGFAGVDDPAWSMAISLMMHLFPKHSQNVPAGMNPLQQQLALMMIKKVRENMEGWYPPLTRVLLSTLGPYEQPNRPAGRSADVILRDAFYRELKKLRVLYDKTPEKVEHYLPPNVTYDRRANALTYRYHGGSKVTTALGRSLRIPEIDLTDDANLRPSPPGATPVAPTGFPSRGLQPAVTIPE